MESQAPISWNATSSTGTPWTRPSTSASSVKIATARRRIAVRQRRVRDEGADLAKAAVMAVAPFRRDQIAGAGERAVAERRRPGAHALGQGEPGEGAGERIGLGRPEVEQGGNEHVAGDAADRVEMEMHGAIISSPAAGTTAWPKLHRTLTHGAYRDRSPRSIHEWRQVPPSGSPRRERMNGLIRRIRATSLRSLLAGSVFATALVWLLAALWISQLRHLERNAAQRELGALATLLADHSDRTLQGVDLLLSLLVGKVETALATPEGRDPAELHAILRAGLAGIPQVRRALLVDTAGESIADSDYPVPRLLNERRQAAFHGSSRS
jgi:hypothetical protein